MKRILYICAVIVLTLKVSYSQNQDPLYSQYTFNPFLINPGFAGHQGFTEFNLTARQQWLGFEDAPSTQAISGQTRIMKTSYMSKSRSIRSRKKKRRPSGKVGLGGYIYNDKNGNVSRTGLQFTYAYHLFIDEGQLSLGVALTAYQFRIDKENLTTHDPNEPLLLGKDNMFAPDGSFGAFYSYGPFFAGLSATQLFQTVLKFGTDNTFDSYQMNRQYYFMTGYKFDINKEFQVEPSFLLSTGETFNINADINVKGYYKNDYWLGFSYRTGSSIVTMVGVRIDKILVGYAFDYSMSEIQRISYGSHELMVSIRFGDNARRYRWLNRF